MNRRLSCTLTRRWPAPAALFVAALSACTGGDSAERGCLEPIDANVTLFVPDLIAAVAGDDGIRLVGLSGAVSNQVVISANDDSVVVAPDGSFDLDLPLADEVELVALRGDQEERLRYRVRTAEDALACVPSRTIPTGTLPNAIAIAPSCDGNGQSALVPLSGDGSLDVVSLSDGARPATTPYFPPLEDQHAAEPFDVAADEDGVVAAVSLRGLSAVALVTPCTGAILGHGLPQTASGEWLVVPVEPTVALREPRDVDGDGIVDTEVRRMRISGPQAVVFSGGRVWVTWTNVLEPALTVDQPMTAGFGVVNAYDLDESQTTLAPAGQIVLPFKNPQGLVADGDGGVWVSATGTYAIDENGALTAGSDGALGHIDAGFRLTHHIDAGRFAPATPALVGRRLIVGSTLRAEVAIVDIDAESISAAEILSLTDSDAVNTVFEVHRLPGGLVALAHFEADALRVLDPTTATLDPFPFTGPVPLTLPDDRTNNTGLLSLLAPPSAPATPTVFRGAKGFSLARWQGAALLGFSAEIVPLDLRQVMGP